MSVTRICLTISRRLQKLRKSPQHPHIPHTRWSWGNSVTSVTSVTRLARAHTRVIYLSDILIKIDRSSRSLRLRSDDTAGQKLRNLANIVEFGDFARFSVASDRPERRARGVAPHPMGWHGISSGCVARHTASDAWARAFGVQTRNRTVRASLRVLVAYARKAPEGASVVSDGVVATPTATPVRSPRRCAAAWPARPAVGRQQFRDLDAACRADMAQMGLV